MNTSSQQETKDAVESSMGTAQPGAVVSPNREESAKRSESGEEDDGFSSKRPRLDVAAEDARDEKDGGEPDVQPAKSENEPDDSVDQVNRRANESIGLSPSLTTQSNVTWILMLNNPEYQNYPYYVSTAGLPSQTHEPAEPYYVYDHVTGTYEAAIRYPSDAAETSKASAVNEAEEYTGYNPKIHGNYDPTAPYATFHQRKREEEAALTAATKPYSAADNPYTAMGAFNRATGHFQTGDVTAERHDDYHKSGRQMGAFFDVDSAANDHGGRSLKEERRNQKLTAKQLREVKERQKQKKEDKKRKWLMS